MRRALSLERCSGAWAVSNWQREARSASTKWGNFLSEPRLLCYAFCKNTNLSVSAERDPSQQMCEWLLPRTATYRRPSLREPFVVTCFTGSTFSRLICLLCGNDEKTFLCWSNTSSIIALDDNSEDNRLIVTIARKGYQFTADVTVAEAADTAKQAAVQVSTAESPLADTQPALRSPADEAVPKAPRHWRKAAVVGASAALLVVVCLASWRHFGGLTPPRSQKIMLAVLPFENLTGDPNKEYLADGLTEEMISQLGRLNPEQLGVIARTSVMGYKHKDERLDQIGHDLSVQYVLENSLRESGDHLRLTAQLIQVKDQTHLWSQDYDYPAKDVLNVEDDVAKAVAREMRLRLTSKQPAELAQSHPVNPEAFDAYLQGYYHFERDTAKDTDTAARYYERATQLDPSYALAWVGLSRARNWQVNVSLIPAEEVHRLARGAVERALAL